MSITLNPGSGGATLATDTVSGTQYEIVKIGFSVAGTAPTQVSATNPLPVAIQPTGITPTDHADVTVAATFTDSTIAANASRKSVTVFNLSSSTGSIRLRLHASGVGGFEILPGASYNLPTQSALDVYNPSSSSVTYGWQEYT